MSARNLAPLTHGGDFPDGVVNVIAGEGLVAGRVICAHVGIDNITFAIRPQSGAEIQRRWPLVRAGVAGAGHQASTIRKSDFGAPQSRQVQSSGTSFQRVPGGMFSSGIPRDSS